MKLKTSLLMIVFVLSALLTGCGTEFDASGYVRACLDANTHGEFDEYARLTNMTAEEIKKKNYDDRLDQEIAYLDTYKADDETKQKFRSLFEKMYNSFKYEVGDAVKNDDGSFTVPTFFVQCTGICQISQRMPVLLRCHAAILQGRLLPQNTSAFQHIYRYPGSH